MPGYIDKDALIKTTEETPFTMSMCVSVEECNGMNRARKLFVKIFKTLPTSDVAPVIHGEWIDMQPPDADGNVQCWCSVCGAEELHAENQVVPYCWKCGAKMDKT